MCDQEDIQDFSNIPLINQMKFITGTMEYESDDNVDIHQDLSITDLAFPKINSHLIFVHYNTVTQTKTSCRGSSSDTTANKINPYYPIG